MKTIVYRGGRARLRKLLARAARVASGHGSAGGAEKNLLVRVGLVVLEKVHAAFLVKSEGGSDETGLRWRPLSPFTIAYKRRHAGVLWPGKKRAKLAPSAALKKKQRERWWAIYKKVLAGGGSRERAAAIAWRVLKGEGARTLIDLYGHAPAAILIDRGPLVKSLTPGGRPGPGSSPPRMPLQVFKIGRGSVTVGTRRKWAWTHHQGAGRVPQRRLWPEPSKWPESWWKEIREQVKIGLVEIIVNLVRGQ